jgi:hypothetical protein
MGVFYYHQGDNPRMPARMTVPLDKTRAQTKHSNSLATTRVRIVEQGKALVGCCRESYLVQAHNKSQYVASGSTGEQQHTIVTLQAKVNDKMIEYLKTRVAKRVAKLCSKKPRDLRKERLVDDEDGIDSDSDYLHTDEEATVQRVGSEDVGAADDSAVASTQLQAEGDDVAPAQRIIEGERFELRADPHIVGKVEWVDRKHTQLRLLNDSGKPVKGSAKAYRPSELRPARLDTGAISIVPWRYLTISALAGAKVHVWWKSEATNARYGSLMDGKWYPGTLRPVAGKESGWFDVVYEDDDNGEVDKVFIGIRSDAKDSKEHVAFLHDGTDIVDEIRIDKVAITAAAQDKDQGADQQLPLAPPATIDSASSIFAAIFDPPGNAGPSASSATDLSIGARGESHEIDYVAPTTIELQRELQRLRDKLTRQQSTFEDEVTDRSRQNTSLQEQLARELVLRQAAERRLVDLRKRLDHEAKRCTELMRKNGELNGQLQLAQRNARAAQRLETSVLGSTKHTSDGPPKRKLEVPDVRSSLTTEFSDAAPSRSFPRSECQMELVQDEQAVHEAMLAAGSLHGDRDDVEDDEQEQVTEAVVDGTASDMQDATSTMAANMEGPAVKEENHAAQSSSIDVDTPNPAKGDRVRVTWLYGRVLGTFDGEVIDTEWTPSSTGMGFFYRYRVTYDDGDLRWETIGDNTSSVVILHRAKRAAGWATEQPSTRRCRH